jgi:alpha-L-rhamnosidase
VGLAPAYARVPGSVWRVLAATMLLTAILGILFPVLPASAQDPSPELRWPTASITNHPWTRWWWLGSAVDESNLTRQLTLFKEAGIGGVEICPIYGAKGYEDKFIDYLSPKWMDRFAYTMREAKRLGLGVDLTTGTGWPFGGPTTTPEYASSGIRFAVFEVSGGGGLTQSLPAGRLQCLRAVSDSGVQIELTDKVQNRRLDWTAPAGNWHLYAAVESGPAQQVKRAAPGGVGSVLDPFSTNAMDHYLSRVDAAFANYHGDMPRSQFHDSYEYYGAQWTPDFFQQFERLRGYDLRTQLAAMDSLGDRDTVARVLCDYRETIADLHLAYIQRWTEWSHAHGSMTREQAHGSPTDLLDVYAAADIPETEIFGTAGERNFPLNKFSSSAAHVSGRTLASSESFTWLTEHFQASLAQVKEAADYLFLTGVNHIFFHGIPYSPAEAPWPGWQFYAAVNFGPQGGLWRDLPEFNAYVTRCESILQSGKSSSDVLLYYPVEDFWNASGQLIEPNPLPRALTDAASALRDHGYAFDYVSDRFLARARVEKGHVTLGGNPYPILMVPECHYMPVETLRNIIELARNGATVVMLGGLPQDVPGLGNLEARRAEFKQRLEQIELKDCQCPGPRFDANIKTFCVASNIASFFDWDAGFSEPCVNLGIQFVRRTVDDGCNYFLANRGNQPVDGWVTFTAPIKSAVIMDPRYEDRTGVAAVREEPTNSTGTRREQVYLQLLPGESCILRTFADQQASGPAWTYYQSVAEPKIVTGDWQVRFLEGGPELPEPFDTHELASWTKLGDTNAERFAGTALYTVEFDLPAGMAGKLPDEWILDLGRVCESARVRLNGHDVGALFSEPFQISLGGLLQPGRNKLEIEVTNLAANRIRDLDRRKVNWKYFYDANVASHNGRGVLDASNWPIFDSGLIGPVQLTPVRKLVLN